MILYRAMCLAEAEKTIELGKPHFIARFKWFSHSASFIRNRVRDGSFAHSNFKPGAYDHILEIEIVSGFDRFTKLNDKELMLDMRKIPMIKFGKIKILTAQDLDRMVIVEDLRWQHLRQAA